MPIMARTLVGLLVAVLLVACGWEAEPVLVDVGGAGQPAEYTENGGALPDGENGGWSRQGDCAHLDLIYGPWPREVSCPEGRIECDGVADDCEVDGTASCYETDGACVNGIWSGVESCLPVCND